MKSNLKSISKQLSHSELKFKNDNKEQQSYLPKQMLRKSSSSLKFNIKNPDATSNKVSNSGQRTSQNGGKIKRSIKTEVEPNGTGAGDGSRRIVGWTELDKIKYELAIQKRLRESLERENEMLKKQITFLNNFGTSMRTSVNSKKNMNEEQHSSNKEKILNRLNRKRQGVTTIQKDNDSTGLYSAKNKTNLDKITQMYEQYTKKRVGPVLENLYEIAQDYFNQFQENYSKLFILFNQTKGLQKTDLHARMQNLLFLFQAPISYKQKPKELMKEISKQKLNSQKSSLNSSFSKVRVNSQIKNESPKEDQLPQYKSPSEIIQQLENLLIILMKNGKLLAKFLKSETYEKFSKKIKDKKL